MLTRNFACRYLFPCLIRNHVGLNNMGINITTGRQESDRPWQVTFKTIDRQEFCRGTLPAERTEDEVRKWAMDQCAVYGLTYALIERW
jgi:hypothetical protein